MLVYTRAARSLCSLSHRERECTELAALLSFPRKREPMITGRWNMGPRFRGDDGGETDWYESA